VLSSPKLRLCSKNFLAPGMCGFYVDLRSQSTDSCREKDLGYIKPSHTGCSFLHRLPSLLSAPKYPATHIMDQVSCLDSKVMIFSSPSFQMGEVYAWLSHVVSSTTH
jgi:hypothetical protein